MRILKSYPGRPGALHGQSSCLLLLLVSLLVPRVPGIDVRPGEITQSAGGSWPLGPRDGRPLCRLCVDVDVDVEPGLKAPWSADVLFASLSLREFLCSLDHPPKQLEAYL